MLIVNKSFEGVSTTPARSNQTNKTKISTCYLSDQVFDLQDCYETIKNKAQKAQSAARAQALAVSGNPEAASAALQVVG